MVFGNEHDMYGMPAGSSGALPRPSAFLHLPVQRIKPRILRTGNLSRNKMRNTTLTKLSAGSSRYYSEKAKHNTEEKLRYA